MNNFWRYVVKEAVSQNYSWERLIKAYPELDEPDVEAYYERVKENTTLKETTNETQ